jgi:hypothetical protein
MPASAMSTLINNVSFSRKPPNIDAEDIPTDLFSAMVRSDDVSSSKHTPWVKEEVMPNPRGGTFVREGWSNIVLRRCSIGPRSVYGIILYYLVVVRLP